MTDDVSEISLPRLLTPEEQDSSSDSDDAASSDDQSSISSDDASPWNSPPGWTNYDETSIDSHVSCRL